MKHVNDRLIFDVGLHKGLDAEFYLSKGFAVMGLEASPDLCVLARDRNAAAVASGELKIVEKALFDIDGQTIEFFINPEKDDWGSIYRGGAEKGVGDAVVIRVPTVTLKTLFDEFGIPHYLKCDIEGSDALLARQLMQSTSRPRFVSLEATNAADLAALADCGYNRFQLVNQYLHFNTSCPSPSREGTHVDAHFTHEMSGLFGRDLPREKWTDFSKANQLFLDWHSLHDRDPSLAIGWLDVHACQADSLA